MHAKGGYVVDRFAGKGCRARFARRFTAERTAQQYLHYARNVRRNAAAIAFGYPRER
jgi:hypothetical protein